MKDRKKIDKKECNNVKLNYIILPILLFTNQLLAEVSSTTAITNSRNAASELSSTINSTYISNFSNTISAPATSRFTSNNN